MPVSTAVALVPRPLGVECASMSVEGHHLEDVRLGGWAYGPELGTAPVTIIVGGITALFSSMFIAHVVMGIVLAVSPDSFPSHGKGPPPAMGWVFAIMGGAFVLAGWTIAALLIVAGRAIGRRRRYTLCFIVAALACLMMPFGTVLGVFSLIVLNRPSVKLLFEANKPA